MHKEFECEWLDANNADLLLPRHLELQNCRNFRGKAKEFLPQRAGFTRQGIEWNGFLANRSGLAAGIYVGADIGFPNQLIVGPRDTFFEPLIFGLRMLDVILPSTLWRKIDCIASMDLVLDVDMKLHRRKPQSGKYWTTELMDELGIIARLREVNKMGRVMQDDNPNVGITYFTSRPIFFMDNIPGCQSGKNFVLSAIRHMENIVHDGSHVVQHRLGLPKTLGRWESQAIANQIWFLKYLMFASQLPSDTWVGWDSQIWEFENIYQRIDHLTRIMQSYLNGENGHLVQAGADFGWKGQVWQEADIPYPNTRSFFVKQTLINSRRFV